MYATIFFHVYDGVHVPDGEGTELRDVYEAQAEAVLLSGELLREAGGKFWNGDEWKVVVIDEAGKVLFTLTFKATEHPHSALLN